MKLTIETISPADMLLFADVVQLGSFTAAARKLGISKQAVSERVGKLEGTLGVRLLQRTTRSMKPTEAGLRYQEQCLQISSLIDQANANMQAEQSEPMGTLTVSAPNLFGRSGLISMIKQYHQRYPKVHVNLRLADRMVQLVEEGVDIALRVSQMNDSNLSVRRLGTAHAYFVASPELMARVAAKNDADLVRIAPAIAFRQGEVWEMFDGAKVKPNAVMTVDDLVAVSAAAAQGVGVAKLPGMLCKPLAEQGKLQILFDGQPAASFSVYAAYLSKKQLAPKIRSFIDMLVEQRALFSDAD
ncbi:MAG: LysR family transcriptional regulator [Brachymonas sp.]|nr:LysR family transcriptional regulator [Brachymonas sp.]